jgi:biotin/methionine sulfoxide reductase
MRQAVAPFAKARNDYDVFSDLSSKLGIETAFTENRNEMQWIEHLYSVTRQNAGNAGIDLPSFEIFWAGDQFSVSDQIPDRQFDLERFRTNPNLHPLSTPSGKIEIFSKVIHEFRYADCPGHPVWLEHQEWLGSGRVATYPIHLISNQPKTRLHSQFDHGRTSQEAKVKGREVMRMSPCDAAIRNINQHDIVRVFNDRGACLAAAFIDTAIMPGVIELQTGAWYEPLDAESPNSLEIHGNPNVLTRDIGTSQLAQGSTAQSCLVDVQRFSDPLPNVRFFSPSNTA